MSSPQLLIERFPSSTHVRRQEGLVLVTKDEDFLDLSVTRGCPPKVVCLAIGNASNAATAILLLQQAETIERFCSHPEAGFLL